MLACTTADLNLGTVARLAGVSPAQASRVLPRLVALGVVERRDVPPSSLYGALEPGTDGFVEVAECCRYIPRGHRWTWRGTCFGALGGAFSIDWRDRTPGKSWWPEEVTTTADVDRLGTATLDVLVAHDAPEGVPFEGFRLPAEDQVRTDEVRRLVRAATEATQPKLVLHGHWHRRHSYELAWPVESDGELAWRSAQVEGLAADVQGDFQAWGILELDPLRFLGGEASRVAGRRRADRLAPR